MFYTQILLRLMCEILAVLIDSIEYHFKYKLGKEKTELEREEPSKISSEKESDLVVSENHCCSNSIEKEVGSQPEPTEEKPILDLMPYTSRNWCTNIVEKEEIGFHSEPTGVEEAVTIRVVVPFRERLVENGVSSWSNYLEQLYEPSEKGLYVTEVKVTETKPIECTHDHESEERYQNHSELVTASCAKDSCKPTFSPLKIKEVPVERVLSNNDLCTSLIADYTEHSVSLACVAPICFNNTIIEPNNFVVEGDLLPIHSYSERIYSLREFDNNVHSSDYWEDHWLDLENITVNCETPVSCDSSEPGSSPEVHVYISKSAFLAKSRAVEKKKKKQIRRKKRTFVNPHLQYLQNLNSPTIDLGICLTLSLLLLLLLLFASVHVSEPGKNAVPRTLPICTY